MFKITFQTSLYAQNLLIKKEDFDIKSCLIYSSKFLKLTKLSIFQYKEGQYVLETIFWVFLCSVQGVQCVLYNQSEKINCKIENFDIKYQLT